MDDRIAQLEARIKTLEKELQQSRTPTLQDRVEEWASKADTYRTQHEKLQTALELVLEYLSPYVIEMHITREFPNIYRIHCSAPRDVPVSSKKIDSFTVWEDDDGVIKVEYKDVTTLATSWVGLRSFDESLYKEIFSVDN